jgi:dephospho-CoA kinase
VLEMLRVGLTGGLASGKSFVGETLRELGCFLVKADELGHSVLLPGGEAYEEVIREFGRGILDEEGRIDRRRLGGLVFDNPERLERLSAIIHPLVIRREEELIAQAEAEDPHGIAVVEAAILIETGSYRRFQKLILAVCSEAEQIERAMRRDHLSREEVLARLRRQMPLEEKKKYADYIVDTSGPKEYTVEQTRRVYENLRRLASS